MTTTILDFCLTSLLSWTSCKFGKAYKEYMLELFTGQITFQSNQQQHRSILKHFTLATDFTNHHCTKQKITQIQLTQVLGGSEVPSSAFEPGCQI